MTTLNRYPFLFNFFSVIGVLPPFSFNQNQLTLSWKFKLKACVLIVTFTVLSLTTLVARNYVANHRPVAYIITDSFTGVSLLLLIVFNLYYPWSYQSLYEQVFMSLFQLNIEPPINNLNLRRYLFRLSVSVAVLLWYYTPPKWTFNTRYLIGALGYFHQELILTFYFLNISFIHEALLTKCKMEFQNFNHCIFSFRQSTIYDENHIQIKIKKIKYTFIKLIQTTQILNKILSPTILFLPMFCCGYLLQFCLYIKRVRYDYSTSLEYTISAFAFITMFVVTSWPKITITLSNQYFFR